MVEGEGADALCDRSWAFLECFINKQNTHRSVHVCVCSMSQHKCLCHPLSSRTAVTQTTATDSPLHSTRSHQLPVSQSTSVNRLKCLCVN